MWKRHLYAVYGIILWITRPGRAVLHYFFGPRYIGNHHIPHHSLRRSYRILRMLDELSVDPQRERWLQMMLSKHLEHLD
jgi:hypothetical protein